MKKILNLILALILSVIISIIISVPITMILGFFGINNTTFYGFIELCIFVFTFIKLKNKRFIK